MKRLIICLSLVLTFYSCNVLDTQPYDRVSEDIVWGDANNATSFILGTYAQILPDLAGGGITSDIYTPNNLAVGGANYDKAYPVFSEAMTRDVDMGFNNWADIRRCNLIITKVGNSLYDEETKKAMIAEGKFLRALSYLSVARNIGRIVWVDKVLTPEDDLLLPSTKNPQESYQYIIQDLKDAVAGLPETSQAGRANKYTAAAILCEAGLEAIAYENYPAAPSINAGLVDMVIENAKLVIEEGGYSLESDYGSMFNDINPTSSETILAYYLSKATTTLVNTPIQAVLHNATQGVAISAWWNYGPSYSLTRDYLTIDKADPTKAYPWNETSQYQAAVDESATIPTEDIPKSPDEVTVRHGVIKPGSSESFLSLTNEGRDARWKATFITDSSTFVGNTFTTCVFGNSNRWRRINGNDEPGVTYITSIYWRKGVYTNVPVYSYSTPTDYHYVITRLGRVYLNLAEAYLLKGDVPSAVAAMNQTRTVHGQLPGSSATTLAEAWTDYKRERKVDLTFENDYYWSLLRWGRYGGPANHGNAPGKTIPELTERPQVLDISLSRKAYAIVEGPFFGLNDQRSFDPTRRYLFPISQDYLDRNPKFGPQNPGW